MRIFSKLIYIFFLAFIFATGCKKDSKMSGDPVTGVKLFTDEVTLVVGSASTFTATVEPKSALNKNVTWVSSDATVASITEAGLVTALKIGTTTLTATTVEGNKTASLTLNITDRIIEIINISFVNPPVSLPLNATSQMEVKLNPTDATNKSIRWASSDENIILVSETGLLTGKAVGTATIIATSIEGNHTASAEIAVTSGSLPVVSVSLPTIASVIPTGTLQLTPVIEPALATNNKVSWSSSDESVATVSTSGLITGITFGTATITVTTEDGNKIATCLVSVEKQNFVLNPGFENDLTSYGVNYGTGVSVVTDPSLVHTGTKAIVIGPGEGEGKGQDISGDFAAGNYTFAAWCKVDVAGGSPVEMGVRCYDAAGTRLVDIARSDEMTTTYGKILYSFVAPTGTVKIRVYFYNNGGKTMYTDDWSLTKD